MQDITRLSLLCLRQTNSTATTWHGAPLDAAVTLNKCLGDKQHISQIRKCAIATVPKLNYFINFFETTE
jgi:hypothetical protein